MASESKPVKLIGLPTALGVTFIVLKLCGVIDWEWIWVLAPFWVPLCAAAAVFAVMAVVVVACAALDIGVKGRRQ